MQICTFCTFFGFRCFFFAVFVFWLGGELVEGALPGTLPSALPGALPTALRLPAQSFG